jgi:hypothetical protein
MGVYRKRYVILLAVLTVTVFTMWGCGRRASNEVEWLNRGAEIVRPFKLDLKDALTKALEKGPDQAIGVCKLQAPMIAARVGEEDIRVGRTSHKLRNPVNQPRPWMQPLLDTFLEDPLTAGPQVVGLADDRVGYVEPIYVQAVCLMCHGDNIGPDVAATIDRLYPNDEARGFAEGEFRGLFWAEFPAASE